jgi:hypothetical protein
MLEGALEIIMFNLMETIHVELSDKAVNFVMSEVFGEDDLLEFVNISDDELSPIG